MADLPIEVAALLLVFARIGAVLMLLPVFGEDAVPGQVRLLMALGVSLALFPLLRPEVVGLAGQTDVRLAGSVIAELLTGVAIGLLIRLMFQAATITGALVSLHVGLTTALVFDPLGGQTPLLGKLFALAAALICFATGIHHLWFAAMVKSYALFPPGGFPDAANWAELAVMTVSQAMALALSLAAPFLLYGLIFNVALGFSARLAPAIQVFFIAQPLNLLLGFALLVATIGTILQLFAERFGGWLAGGLALG